MASHRPLRRCLCFADFWAIIKRAHERRGGSTQLPGLDPDAVAEEGLLHLGEGPVWVAGETTREVHGFLVSLPRAEAADYLEIGTRRIFGLEPMEED